MEDGKAARLYEQNSKEWDLPILQLMDLRAWQTLCPKNLSFDARMGTYLPHSRLLANRHTFLLVFAYDIGLLLSLQRSDAIQDQTLGDADSRLPNSHLLRIP